MASAKGQRSASIYNAGLFLDNQNAQTDMLQGYGSSALSALGQGQQTANAALNENAGQALNALGAGYGQGRTDIAGGYTGARADTQAGIDLFNPWVNNGTAASNAQSDFMGLNGAAASGAQTTALNNWRDSTGYRDVVDQTSDAALRRASVIGGLGGNQIDAVARIGGNLANQTNQQYFTNLGSLSQTGLQAAGQQQQGYNTMASLGAQQGRDMAGLATGQADREAGVYTGLGSSLGNVAMSGGQNQANIYTGLGNSLADLGKYTVSGITSGVTSAGQARDAAKNANQQTAVNIGTTLFNAGTKLFGL